MGGAALLQPLLAVHVRVVPDTDVRQQIRLVLGDDGPDEVHRGLALEVAQVEAARHAHSGDHKVGGDDVLDLGDERVAHGRLLLRGGHLPLQLADLLPPHRGRRQLTGPADAHTYTSCVISYIPL